MYVCRDDLEEDNISEWLRRRRPGRRQWKGRSMISSRLHERISGRKPRHVGGQALVG